MFSRDRISFKMFAGILIIVFYAMSLVSGMPSEVFAGECTTEITDFQKGICFATWTKDRFKSKYSQKSLELLKGMGVEFLQVNVTQFQEAFNSTDIFPTKCTPSDRSVKYVIKKAHDLGLKVMLKPHIDIISKEDGYWRADIGFYDQQSWEKWFREYEKFIRHYAAIAQKYDVEIFCVGTELSFTTQQVDLWRDVIRKIKKKYKGKLTYAANWDNYSNVEFWDELDYVGIDAYFPLTYKCEPTVEDIRGGWRKWVCEIGAWYSEVEKPIIFTEIGYPSSDHAAYEPWKSGSGCADVTIQAKCYAAFFDVVWEQPWLAGVYWWRWAPTIFGGGENNRQFTPLKKPAAKLIEQKYKTARYGAVLLDPKGGSTPKLLTREMKNMQESGINISKALDQSLGHPGKLVSKGAIDTSTLIPALKTHKDHKFQKDWKERNMLECVN